MLCKSLEDNGLATGNIIVRSEQNNPEDFALLLISGGAYASGIDGVCQAAADGRQHDGRNTLLW